MGCWETGGWGRDGGYTTCSYCPHVFGVCLAGRVGGQATQSGSTRTPCPAVAVVAAVGGTCFGLTPRIYLGGGAGNADHSILGETDKLR